MTNIQNNLLFNACWCVFYILAFVMFICVVQKMKAKGKKFIYGFLLLAIKICYHAVLAYSYFRMSDGTHSIVMNWHKFAVIASGIQELLTTATIFAILLLNLKQMTKKQGLAKNDTQLN